MVVIAARHLLLLQEGVLSCSITKLVELVEHREGRKTFVVGVLRGIEQHGAHLPRARSGRAFVNRVRVALVVNVRDGRVQVLGAVVVQALRRGSGRVEIHLLHRREIRHQRAQRLVVAIGVRAPHSGQHREHGGELRRVGGNVFAHLRRDLRRRKSAAPPPSSGGTALGRARAGRESSRTPDARETPPDAPRFRSRASRS